ncbi:mitosis protein DIM1-domain-containing protein, partial [Cyathus striatus]
MWYPGPWLESRSYPLCPFLPHLPSGWHVDEAIKSEEDRVVVIRFGHDWDSQCMVMDESLYVVAEKVQNFAVIYLVDITEMYELYDTCTHIMIDLGTGNNNKINWAMDNKQEVTYPPSLIGSLSKG